MLRTGVLDAVIIFSDERICRMKVLKILVTTWKEYHQQLREAEQAADSKVNEPRGETEEEQE
jgi:hypothetical protein